MIRTIKKFSNFDVYAIVKELDLILSNGSISNVYEVQDLLVVKINTSQGKKNLIVKEDSRINLTEYDYPVPKYPSQYIMSLRKFLTLLVNSSNFLLSSIIAITPQYYYLNLTNGSLIIFLI